MSHKVLKTTNFYGILFLVKGECVLQERTHFCKYAPLQPVTRAEMATIVCRMLGETENLTISNTFTDSVSLDMHSSRLTVMCTFLQADFPALKCRISVCWVKLKT